MIIFVISVSKLWMTQKHYLPKAECFCEDRESWMPGITSQWIM
jgi:hypothetical protein